MALSGRSRGRTGGARGPEEGAGLWLDGPGIGAVRLRYVSEGPKCSGGCAGLWLDGPGIGAVLGVG